MIITFTGTQEGMTERQLDNVAFLLKRYRPCIFRHGMCIGSDIQAHVICQTVSPLTEIHGFSGYPKNRPKDTSKRGFCLVDVKHPPQEYLERNITMLKPPDEPQADLVIATPFELEEQLRSGTWATVRGARNRKIPRIVLLGELQK